MQKTIKGEIKKTFFETYCTTREGASFYNGILGLQTYRNYASLGKLPYEVVRVGRSLYVPRTMAKRHAQQMRRGGHHA